MSQDETTAAGNRGTYVYGIVRAGTSLDSVAEAEDGLPDVRLIESGDIAALVSAGPERASREVVLGHGRVLEAVLDGSPVIPLQFGMVLKDDDAVHDEILEGHHDELAELLERLDGRVQMTLKVYYHEDAVVADILSANPKLAELREAIQGRSEDESRPQRIKLGQPYRGRVGRRRRPGRPLCTAAPRRRDWREGAHRQFRRGQEIPDRQGRQGQSPRLSRRRRGRRGRQYRCRHHHLQL